MDMKLENIMPRTINATTHEQSRIQLLRAGIELIQSKSFSEVGLQDILQKAGIPKGSFYHYFKNKETYAIEVAEYYHLQQIEIAREILRNQYLPPIERLQYFFQKARTNLADKAFKDGCLMCNLSTELAATHPNFQRILKKQWSELAQEFSMCIALLDDKIPALSELTNDEAANWLLNAWSGTLTRMKAEGTDMPLDLFNKSFFGHLKG